MQAHSIIFYLMEWKHLENREKYVIYNIKPHLFFQWEWRDESSTDNVTKKNHRGNSETEAGLRELKQLSKKQRKTLFIFHGPGHYVAFILLFYFTDLFGRNTVFMYVVIIRDY